MANVFEAVIAAIYLDGGIFEAKEFIVRNLYHQVLAVNQKEHSVNYKSILQQHLQREDGSTPNYRVLSESGPDHAKEFVVQAMLKRKPLGTGEGTTKKEAEQAAAKEALEQLGIDPSA
jgi:ribonuclease-3